ncbi:MAG: metal-dependent transcriptional regulator [Candidatus Thorarchaeota archaeon]
MVKKILKINSQISDIPESYQRYLDEIYIISRRKKGGWVSNSEIAENLHVEPASVTGMLEKLKKRGLINWEPRKAIRLTEEGKKIARQLNEIHSLLYQFFSKVLKIKDETTIEKLSCEIEHHITRDVKNSLEEFLSKYTDD